MKKLLMGVFTLLYMSILVFLINLISRNFIGALPGVLTVVAWVAAFIVSVGLAQFTIHKIEETDF